MDLNRVKALITPEMERVESTIRQTLSADTEALRRLVEHLSLFGGKRLRPALVLVVSKALGETSEDHVKLGAVIELIHTASLVHDDILDGAEMRRRVPSVNHLYGNHVPVLLGDLVYARAFGLSLTLSTPRASHVLSRVTQTICAGEIEQMHHRGDFEVGEALYFAIIEAKTASLYAAACGLAAEYSGAPGRVCRGLDRYGRALGIAFQIVDDCLDIVGDEAVVGKSLGTDTEWGKMTLPLIHLAARLEGKEREALKTIFLSEPEKDKNARIAERFDLGPSVDYAFSRADGFIAEAREELKVLPPSECRDALAAVAEFVLHRKL